MEIWIIKDGEKTGPVLDFELRTQIRSGNLTREDKIWHSEMDAWTPLGEVDLFVNEFASEAEEAVTAESVEDYLSELDRFTGIDQEQDARPARDAMSPGLPAPLHLWRRFGARWFDYLAYMMVFYTLILVSDVTLAGLRSETWFPLLFILPWFLCESAALNYWGTTPGKWLVGLSVKGADGDKLSLSSSLLRTSRVMILGMGFGQIILREVCHLFALWIARKKRIVIWDVSSGIRLYLKGESAGKWVTFGVGIMVLIVANLTMLMLIDLQEMSPEERKERLDNPWKLPEQSTPKPQS